MSKVAREAAAAVHRAIGKQAESDSRGRIELGIIRDFKPMKIELTESGDVLVEDNTVYLTQFLRWWERQYGLVVGDMVLLASVREAVWMAFDVRAPDRSVRAGVKPGDGAANVTEGAAEGASPTSSESGLFTLGSVPAGGGTPSVTWNRHIGHKLPVYKADGTLLGYVPVFDTLP